MSTSAADAAPIAGGDLRPYPRPRIRGSLALAVKRYRSLHVDAPAELEDEISGWLFAAGGEGSWTEALSGDRIRIHAFFDESALPDDERLAALTRAFAEVERSALVAVPPRDWGETWRRGAQPILVGDRFLIDPREPEDITGPVEAGGRILLRLPARTAFGMPAYVSSQIRECRKR